MRDILSFYFFGTIYFTNGQNVRLAYLDGDKYAVVDENGKEILPHTFDKVVISIEYNILKLSKGGFWGIYTFDGTKILNHITRDKRGGFIEPQVFNTAAEYLFKTRSKKQIKCDLLTEEDKDSEVFYYINPNALLKSYKPYSSKIPTLLLIYKF